MATGYYAARTGVSGSSPPYRCDPVPAGKFQPLSGDPGYRDCPQGTFVPYVRRLTPRRAAAPGTSPCAALCCVAPCAVLRCEP